MENKISTSIQYQFTNCVFFDELFLHWEEFKMHLDAGPDDMKNYIYQKWNQTKQMLLTKPNLELKDLNKMHSIDEFDVTFNRTQNGSSVFFFTFPDYDFRDAASKCVAIAFTKNGPKYITLEYSENIQTKMPCWVIGEFYVENNKRAHKNYGAVDNCRIPFFAGKVLELLSGMGL